MDDLKKPEVFAAYYEKVYRELYYFALHTLKNPQDAEDAVSETVTDAFAAVEKLRDNVNSGHGFFRYCPINAGAN